MTWALEAGIALVIVIGIVGTVVPLFPGPGLVAAAVVVYALIEQTRAAWITCAICLTILAIGFVAKYLIPAKLVSGEVDRWPLLMGAAAAIVGFFAIPVVGLPVGFVLGVLGTELVRTRAFDRAWAATKQALAAAGLSMLIDLAAVVVTGCVWMVAVVLY